jgi:hypothetical protein
VEKERAKMIGAAVFPAGKIWLPPKRLERMPVVGNGARRHVSLEFDGIEETFD